MTFDLPSSNLWLIFSIIALLLEIFILPAMGLVFASISAAILGLILTLNVIDLSLENQLLSFTILTILTYISFIKKYRKILSNTKEKISSDIIGSEVIVYEEINSTGTGKIKWSGTIILARMDNGSAKKDETVIIESISGNIATCKKH